MFFYQMSFVLQFIAYLQALQGKTKAPPSSAEKPQTASNGLDPPWSSAVDANSGRTYYYNSVTKVVQWEPPPSATKVIRFT